MPDSVFPHRLGGGKHHHHPPRLNGQPCPKLGSPHSLQKDLHGKEQFIREREPAQDGLEPGGHDIQRESLAAQEIFEGEENEYDGADFQNPERHQRERVGDQERDRRRHGRGDKEQRPGPIRFGEHDVLAEPIKRGRHRQNGDERVDDPRGDKQRQPVTEVVERLDHEGTDLAFADIGGDLPFVLGGGDEVVDQDHEEKIPDHRRIIVRTHGGLGPGEDGPPDEHRADQRHQPEQGAEQEIPPVHKGVLQTDIKNFSVFEKHGVGAVNDGGKPLRIQCWPFWRLMGRSECHTIVTIPSRGCHTGRVSFAPFHPSGKTTQQPTS